MGTIGVYTKVVYYPCNLIGALPLGLNIHSERAWVHDQIRTTV